MKAIIYEKYGSPDVLELSGDGVKSCDNAFCGHLTRSQCMPIGGPVPRLPQKRSQGACCAE